MGFAHGRSWDIGSIAFYFSMAAGIYLYARLVSPRIPERGEIDLQRFHSEEGRKYLIAYTILGVVTAVANAVLGQAAGVSQWPAQNIVIAPMTIATGVAAIFINSRWVQILALAIQIARWIWYLPHCRRRYRDDVWCFETDEEKASLAEGVSK